MSRIPEIIAHRGASREAHENTLTAFRLALDHGVDGIELDVHATASGTVVVHHDADVPVLGADGTTAKMPIRLLDDETWRTVRLSGGEPVPSLDEVLTLVGARATVYVEVKSTGIEGDVARCLARHPNTRHAVHAFDHRIPVAMRASNPSLPIGVLSTSYPVDLEGFIGAAHPRDLWQVAPLIDRALVESAASLGARVVAWTVNDIGHARSLVAMGVEAICTDDPSAMCAALRRDL